MRATINFEVDLGRVNETMMELVSTQVEYLIDAATCLSARMSGEPGNLLEALSETLEKIDRETAQLRQYRDMLTSFERARFETLLPQPAMMSTAPSPPGKEVRNVAELKQSIESMKDFDSFLNQINPAEEGPDDTEEG